MAEGWTVDRMDIQAVQSVVNSVNMMSKDKKPFTKIKSVAKAVSQFAGVPVYNTLREFESIYNFFSDTNLGEPVAKNDKRIEILYDAIVNGDEKTKDKVIEAMLGEGKEVDDIIKSLSKKINKTMKESITEGDSTEAQEQIDIITEFKEENDKDPADIRKAIKSSLTSEFKPQFLDGNTDVKSALLELKFKGEQIYKSTDFDDWKKDAGK